MDHEQVSLTQVVRMARAGRKFFIAATQRISDAGVRDAFEHIAEVKSRLITDLEPWLFVSGAGAGEQISAAASMEKVYADLDRSFQGEAPASSAQTLARIEDRLLGAIKRAFEDARKETLRNLLKSYHPQLVICREAMMRLRGRQAA